MQQMETEGAANTNRQTNRQPGRGESAAASRSFHRDKEDRAEDNLGHTGGTESRIRGSERERDGRNGKSL